MLQKTELGFLGEMADGRAEAGKIQDEAGAPVVPESEEVLKQTKYQRIRN